MNTGKNVEKGFLGRDLLNRLGPERLLSLHLDFKQTIEYL